MPGLQALPVPVASSSLRSIDMSRALCAFVIALLLGACGGGGSSSPISEAQAATPRPRAIAFGDSLTAGYIPVGGYPQLRQDLAYTRELAPVVDVVTLAVGGATSADGLGYQAATLRGLPAGAVVVMFGINDALKGLTAAQTSDNIDRILAGYPGAKRVVIAPPLWSEQTRAVQAALTEELRVRSLIWGAVFIDRYTPSANLAPYCTADRHPCEDWHRETGRLVAAALQRP
jgi:hypothetical protein